MATRLKLYTPAPEETEVRPDPEVHVRLSDLIPVVAMAQRHNFVWLKDFMDDEVCITDDLHQVLQTFRGCRPSA